MYFNSVHPFMGVSVGLKSFCAAVVGELAAFPEPCWGIFIGIVEVLGVAAGFDTYKEAIAFGLLILVLLFRPTGLLGLPIQRKV